VRACSIAAEGRRRSPRSGARAAGKSPRHFAWDFYPSEDAVVTRRARALERFSADRTSHPSRYVAAALPLLPFADAAFDLVLCSHFLFLYSAELTTGLHVAALREMLRVGRELRVFPLLDLEGTSSAHLEPALAALEGEAHAQRVPVPFEFRRGAREMLRLTSRRVPA
jgi:ubiquinone/menaquinone biosynthesis C-methylase UbiE